MMIGGLSLSLGNSCVVNISDAISLNTSLIFEENRDQILLYDGQFVKKPSVSLSKNIYYDLGSLALNHIIFD